MWQRTKSMRQAADRSALKREMRAPIDLTGVSIDFVSNPDLIGFNESIPSTAASRAVIADAFSRKVAV